MKKNSDNLIWIDLEMTGLSPLQDGVIEIATIVTNKDLEDWAEGPSLVIHQPNEVLDTMDEWNQQHHSQSGLIDEVHNSTISYKQAEQETLKFLMQYVSDGESPMCGNSICQDRRFLARVMPTLEQFFHYRNLDVSSVGELVRRWFPDKTMSKHSAHRAMDDVRQSIFELQYYRKHFFNAQNVSAQTPQSLAASDK